MKDIAYIALGSNLGRREVFLADARRAIAELPRTDLLAETEVEETAPIGPVPQGPFLNQMIAVQTELTPTELLSALQEIEQRAERKRGERWGPRTLDLDIVSFERQTVDEPGLKVPHPELPNRAFWRRELAQLRGSAVG
ncbi:MAG TPA: 2-amino-4-hydroxy-6-hydroxymethyldihydropteridine diphosphokinase [Gemmatimonadaceae bacterium]|nr:2-amino-4-hydroxy-6-hydroxymethyldihydropteridine diphosphokinase [Gemmatimonadaceae bacterium]